MEMEEHHKLAFLDVLLTRKETKLEHTSELGVNIIIIDLYQLAQLLLMDSLSISIFFFRNIKT